MVVLMTVVTMSGQINLYEFETCIVSLLTKALLDLNAIVTTTN